MLDKKFVKKMTKIICKNFIMDVDIIFENKQVEFFSKSFTELIKNDKIKKCIRLASSKIFLNKILNNLNDEKKKIKTIIYKDIWHNSEML